MTTRNSTSVKDISKYQSVLPPVQKLRHIVCRVRSGSDLGHNQYTFCQLQNDGTALTVFSTLLTEYV